MDFKDGFGDNIHTWMDQISMHNHIIETRASTYTAHIWMESWIMQNELWLCACLYVCLCMHVFIYGSRSDAHFACNISI